MKELSSHILDLIANSKEAGASLVSLSIEESKEKTIPVFTEMVFYIGVTRLELAASTSLK